ncbi:uncharacterized protein BO97DRAFT_79134 [Aspergillus homomorphus CBS 101889]|uniref:Uncharacterized protein n=1 Tax=Aspergillus homomorphus (strain CBS 101889) TaxID=1450537 RepID=A0A395I9S3_ASPHC|nr:hypothetical protein BO97DRAFT_79134 [Aspergillus homomorphus CBS 101889]RAL16917.1 hypothetical protein BO97DRAFT_79134 [Aspergillus homomorphus CBS 101889]
MSTERSLRQLAYYVNFHPSELRDNSVAVETEYGRARCKLCGGNGRCPFYRCGWCSHHFHHDCIDSLRRAEGEQGRQLAFGCANCGTPWMERGGGEPHGRSESLWASLFGEDPSTDRHEAQGAARFGSQYYDPYSPTRGGRDHHPKRAHPTQLGSPRQHPHQPYERRRSQSPPRQLHRDHRERSPRYSPQQDHLVYRDYPTRYSRRPYHRRGYQRSFPRDSPRDYQGSSSQSNNPRQHYRDYQVSSPTVIRCPFCFKTQQTWLDLKVHCQCYHRDVGPVCPRCQVKLEDWQGFLRHYEVKHYV